LSAPDPAAEAPAFEAPWQAQAFAMMLALHERGLFSWPEWTEALGAALKGQDDYYAAWIEALEGLLTARGVAAPGQIEALSEAWSRAAEATPHGVPILLENDPLHQA
jgi:nitrile hydratase accessory protein